MRLVQNENARNENNGLLGILSTKRMRNPKTVSFVGRLGMGNNLRERKESKEYDRLMYFAKRTLFFTYSVLPNKVFSEGNCEQVELSVCGR